MEDWETPGKDIFPTVRQAQRLANAYDVPFALLYADIQQFLEAETTKMESREHRRIHRLRQRVMDGGSDAAISFDQLRGFLLYLGFNERTRGSHHIFQKDGVRDLVNLQRDGHQAKPYQVRQVRRIILSNDL